MDTKFQQAVTQCATLGWRPIYQSDVTAVFEAGGSGVSQKGLGAGEHLMFFLGGFISAGILWIVWPFVALSAQKNRKLNFRTLTVTYDPVSGEVTYRESVAR